MLIIIIVRLSTYNDGKNLNSNSSRLYVRDGYYSKFTI